MMGILACITSCAIGFPGGGQELTERGRAPRRELQCIEGATEEAQNAALDVANHDMEGVAKGSGLASAVAASARGTLGDGIAVCRTRRVVSFGLIGRFLYVRWESGRTRLRVPR